MLAAFANMPVPDLVAIALVGGLSLLLTAALWRVSTPRVAVRKRPALGLAPGLRASSGALGLPGQWQVQERRIASGLDGQAAALMLHRQAARTIGALDYEIDQLRREIRALRLAPAWTHNVTPFTPPAYTRRPSAPGYAAFLAAAHAPGPAAMAS